MRCELVREHVSAAYDGEAGADALVDEHVAACAGCTAWQQQIALLRKELRFSSVADAPDVAPAVRQRVGAARPRAAWASVAAAFLVSAVVGATLVGLRPEPVDVAVADVPRLVFAAQHAVERLTARVEVREHGWHPAVPERIFSGALRFAAPETLTLTLDDKTAYPSDAWVPNDVVVAVTPQRWWARGLAGCPQAAQPGCAGTPATRVVEGREPFDPHAPIALDLVVPVASFRFAATPTALGMRTVAGRQAVGVRVPVAQAGPILEGLQQVGDWRELHPEDQVDLWLDAAALVPLQVRVSATGSDERSLWAARHGYADDAGDTLLTMDLRDVRINPGTVGSPPGPPAGATVRDAGFRPRDTAALTPSWLPEGMTLYRTGVTTSAEGPTVAVTAWTDGRAWITVRTTDQWRGDRLFGDLGEAVRRVDLGAAGVGYSGRGSSIGVHAPDRDVVVNGSVDSATLRRVAASLPVTGQDLPAHWRDSGAASLESLTRSHPSLLIAQPEGFDSPVVRVAGGTIELHYVGPGARELVLTQAPGAQLTPPLDPNVVGIIVRGVTGRYTPSLGELEWIEGSRVVSLRSHTVSLDELLAIAERLTPA